MGTADLIFGIVFIIVGMIMIIPISIVAQMLFAFPFGLIGAIIGNIPFFLAGVLLLRKYDRDRKKEKNS